MVSSERPAVVEEPEDLRHRLWHRARPADIVGLLLPLNCHRLFDVVGSGSRRRLPILLGTDVPHQGHAGSNFRVRRRLQLLAMDRRFWRHAGQLFVTFCFSRKLSKYDVSLPKEKIKQLTSLLEDDVNKVIRKTQSIILWDNITTSSLVRGGQPLFALID